MTIYADLGAMRCWDADGPVVDTGCGSSTVTAIMRRGRGLRISTGTGPGGCVRFRVAGKTPSKRVKSSLVYTERLPVVPTGPR